MSKMATASSSLWKSHDWTITVTIVTATWWLNSRGHLCVTRAGKTPPKPLKVLQQSRDGWNNDHLHLRQTLDHADRQAPKISYVSDDALKIDKVIPVNSSVCSEWYAGQTTWKSRSKDNLLHPAHITVVVKRRTDLAFSVSGAGRT